jgi:Ser/Thr protein kinase RdoA (MazF antagonist)
MAIHDLNSDPNYILREIAPRFGLSTDDLHVIGKSGSSVFEYYLNNQRYILRIAQVTDSELDLLHGELDWIQYLADKGVSASVPVESKYGHLIEKVTLSSTQFAVISFQSAKGLPPVKLEKGWNDNLFSKWGEVIGQMHALTKSYRPPLEKYKRKEWDETEDLNFIKFVPATQSNVINRCNALCSQLRSFPKDIDSYGLIHADMHRNNFMVDNGRLTVFDFEACHYNWFIYDVAVALFHALMKPYKNMKRPEFAEHFLRNFMTGYQQKNKLDNKWLSFLPIFLKLRRVIMYIDILRYWELDDLSAAREKYLSGTRIGIESDTPIVEMGA